MCIENKLFEKHRHIDRVESLKYCLFFSSAKPRLVSACCACSPSLVAALCEYHVSNVDTQGFLSQSLAGGDALVAEAWLQPCVNVVWPKWKVKEMAEKMEQLDLVNCRIQLH